MAAQISDTFQYKGVDYAVSGISNGPLFEPSLFEMDPTGMCSLCWRGYQSVFAVLESRLVLDTLHINLLSKDQDFAPQEGPEINGVSPTGLESEYDIFNNHYTGMGYPVEYSGGILLADGFINELSFHIGFAPAWKYEHVLELVFANGVLKKEFDRSEQIAGVRKKMLESYDDNDVYHKSSFAESMEFIGKLFDQTYQLNDGK